jgi:hypothetical protein
MNDAIRLNPIAARMRGPGGYYNAGNLIGFATSIGLQLATAADARRPGVEALIDYLAGSPTAIGFTAATTIFLVGGEVYYRAWMGRSVPDPALNRTGDLLSALGALVLTYSLMQLGQPLLAGISGVLLVLGKLGNALFGDGVRIPGWPMTWGDPFRVAVVLGRVPAIGAILIDVAMQIEATIDGRFAGPQLLQSAVLLLCHLLWIKADLMLLSPAPRTASA